MVWDFNDDLNSKANKSDIEVLLFEAEQNKKLF